MIGNACMNWLPAINKEWAYGCDSLTTSSFSITSSIPYSVAATVSSSLATSFCGGITSLLYPKGAPFQTFCKSLPARRDYCGCSPCRAHRGQSKEGAEVYFCSIGQNLGGMPIGSANRKIFIWCVTRKKYAGRGGGGSIRPRTISLSSYSMGWWDRTRGWE